MKNQKEKKLTLARTTIRNLTPDDLGAVVGGTTETCTELNPQPLPP